MSSETYVTTEFNINNIRYRKSDSKPTKRGPGAHKTSFFERLNPFIYNNLHCNLLYTIRQIQAIEPRIDTKDLETRFSI